MWAAQCMHAQEEVQCSQGAIYVVIARRHDRVWTRGGTAALIVRYSIITVNSDITHVVSKMLFYNRKPLSMSDDEVSLSNVVRLAYLTQLLDM